MASGRARIWTQKLFDSWPRGYRMTAVFFRCLLGRCPLRQDCVDTDSAPRNSFWSKAGYNKITHTQMAFEVSREVKTDYSWRRIFLQGLRVQKMLLGRTSEQSFKKHLKSHLARVNSASQIGFQCSGQFFVQKSSIFFPGHQKPISSLAKLALLNLGCSQLRSPGACETALQLWGFSSICSYTWVLALAQLVV